MSVSLRQVLPKDMGITLPVLVHQALMDHGMACNFAAIAVNQATLLDEQARSQEDHVRALARGDQVARVAADLAEAADRFNTLALVTLARAATAYAVYASQIALQIIAGDPVTDSGDLVPRLKPSDVITAAGMYLPRLVFAPRDHHAPQQVTDLNADVERSYIELNNVITHQLRGQDVTLYDEVTTAASLDAMTEVPDVFPLALYDYAANVSWAIGILTGVDTEP